MFLTPGQLQPGDVLLYDGNGYHSWATKFIQWAIKLKTWSKFCHVEFYLGNGQSATARLSHGVNTYTLDIRYVAVLRPLLDASSTINLDLVNEFHKTCISENQKYDIRGLLRFFRIGKESTDKAFCSEHVTRLCRRIKVTTSKDYVYFFRPFSDTIDADTVAPATFYYSPNFEMFEDK